MWTNKPGVASQSPSTTTSGEPLKTSTAFPSTDFHRGGTTAPQGVARLGPGLVLKGELSGTEDLYIESTIEGPISVGGHRVTVGPSGKVHGEVVAREAVVHGKVQGDMRAHDRVEIKRDGSVVGDLTTARIVIEDGAYFKGNIEIDRESKPIGTDLDGLLSRSTPPTSSNIS